MLRTLERPLLAYSIDLVSDALCFLSPIRLERGETIELLPDCDRAGFHRLKWRGKTYACVPEDLLASAAPPIIPIGGQSDHRERSHDSMRCAERQIIAQLRYQLANGAKYEPGDRVPVGWTFSRQRIFIEVTRELLALASSSEEQD